MKFNDLISKPMKDLDLTMQALKSEMQKLEMSTWPALTSLKSVQASGQCVKPTHLPPSWVDVNGCGQEISAPTADNIKLVLIGRVLRAKAMGKPLERLELSPEEWLELELFFEAYPIPEGARFMGIPLVRLS
jgi:hypothetical protein